MKSDAKIIRQMASELKLDACLTVSERALLNRVRDEMGRWSFISDRTEKRLKAIYERRMTA